MNSFRLFLLFFSYAAAVGERPAQAGVSEDIVSRLKSDGGYHCSDILDGGGYFCINKTNYAVVPKGLPGHERNLFYAHGLTGVCGPGVSGENYLKGQVETLRRAKAVAFMPFRKKALDMGYPFSSFIDGIDKVLGTGNLPWDMAGHSAGGQFLAVELLKSPVLSRVQNVLLLDAVYNVNKVSPLWKAILAKNPALRMKIISSTTKTNANALVGVLKKSHADAVELDLVQGDHCTMPKYFDHYNDLLMKSERPKQPNSSGIKPSSSSGSNGAN